MTNASIPHQKVSKFKVGDVVRVLDNEVNRRLFGDQSSFSHFLESKSTFTVTAVDERFNCLYLDDNLAGYDVIRFELCKNSNILTIINAL